VPEIADRHPDLPEPLQADPETEHYRLFDAVAAWIAAVAGDSPVLFVADDIHWATRPTLALLCHLARSGEALRLLVVATYRDTALDVSSDLADALADLMRQPGVDRLRLAGLDEDGVAAFFESQAHHELDESTRALTRALQAEIGGNLFFVGQLMRHLFETGVLVRRDGRWELERALADVGVPDGVREVISQRLARLPDGTRRALEAAAVLGDQFEVAVLTAALGDSELAVLQALDPAISARLVTEAATARADYRFVHALVRATLYDGLPTSQRVSLHERAGDSIAAVHAGCLDDHLPALAQHFALAGSARRADAAAYAAEAGHRSQAQLAYDEAAGWYRRALELHTAAGGPDAGRCELLITLGEAERRAARPEYHRTLLDAARLAGDLGDRHRLARAALANRAEFFNYFHEADPERSALATEALDALGSEDPALRAQLLVAIAAEFVWADNAECERLVTEALDVARGLDDPRALAYVITNAGFFRVDRTRPEWFEELKGQVASIGRFADPAMHFWCVSLASTWAQLEGAWAEADHFLDEATRLAAEIRQPTLRWAAAVMRAARLRVTGRLAEAQLAADEAFEIGTATGNRNAARIYRFQSFFIRLDEGRTGELLDRLTRAATRIAVSPAAEPRLASPTPALVLRCVALFEAGRMDDARTVFGQIAEDDFVAIGYPRLQSLALLAPVCAGLDDGPRAAYLYESLASHAAGLNAMYIVIDDPVAQALGMLATTLGRYDDAERHFGEALTIGERFEAPAFLARTRLEWARMLTRRAGDGDPARAKTLATEALAAAESFGFDRVADRARSLLDQV
jgi:tetratricopeptide (TPR) repeat protein